MAIKPEKDRYVSFTIGKNGELRLEFATSVTSVVIPKNIAITIARMILLGHAQIEPLRIVDEDGSEGSD